MPGLSHLRDVYDKRGKDFLTGLLNKTVIVNEKMDGAFFGAQKDSGTGKFRFFKRNAEITYIDRVLSRYFEPAIRHFENLGPGTVEQIPANYHFGMEWFTSPKAQTIAYDRLPKNGLILSYIHVLDEKGEIAETIQDKWTLDKWADLLEIERPPIVFQGKLSSQQKEKIQEFAYTPAEELIDKFKTSSFTRYIMSVLNPDMQSSFLRDTLDKDIEGLVFRFYDPSSEDEDSVFLAKLVDPVFQARAKEKAKDQIQKKSDDYIWIIAIDLMNFIERYSIAELRDIKLSGNTYEEKYISLINHIYQEFIAEFGEKYADLDIQIPEFLTRAEFGVNFDLVKNPGVIKTIESNTNFKEIYRILLNIFRKKKTRVNSTLFTKQMKDNLNAQIDKISKVIMGDAVFENYFPTFNEFVGDSSEPGYFETFANVPEAERAVKRVNLIVSDFQPIHPGHVKAAQKLSESNGFPSLLICVHNGKTTKGKPIAKGTLENCLTKLTGHNPSTMVGHRVVADGEVESLLKAVKPDFEPVVIAGTKSRVKDIAMQMELAKKRSRDLTFRKDLKLIELPVSLTKSSIMDSIRNGDYVGFKANTPAPIHSEFFNLNRDVSEKLNESVEALSQVEAEPEIDELTRILPNLSKAVLSALLKQAKHSSRKSDTDIKSILISKNIPINSVKSIIHDAKVLGQEDELLDYLENPTVTLADLTAKASLTDLFSEVRISDELKKEIMALTDTRSNVSMGPGEIPIAVFLKNGRINTQDKNGDVYVESHLIEVKMSSKSGAQLASAAYSSRAKKEAMFKSKAGQALIDKYGDSINVKAGGPWPKMLFNISPDTDQEAKGLAFDFISDLYPGLFKSADEIDWSSAILINKSIGIALGMEYLETLGNGKSLMFIGLNRDQYSLIETADEFRAAVEAGTLAFKLASDSVPRCNLVTPGLNEEFDEELESDTEEY